MIITDERFIRNDNIKTICIFLMAFFLCFCVAWLMFHDRKDRKIDAEYKIQLKKDVDESMAKKWGRDNWGTLPPEKPVKKKGGKP